MRIIENQSAELWKQGKGLQGIYEQIEKAARVCYQSQDLIKEGSAERIVAALIKNGHTAMLEHATVYLHIADKDGPKTLANLFDDKHTLVSKVCNDDTYSYYITTNYRVIYNYGYVNKIKKYLCDMPTGYHHRRQTLCLTTNLQVATEYIRHRLMSFAMESTRYCAYDKEKFGNELSFILPLWLKEPNRTKMEMIEWMNAMQDAENHYMRLRNLGWKAEECAQVLNKATKTTLVMTGYDFVWDLFFDLRYFEKTGKAHPQAKELAEIIYNLTHDGK